MYTVLFSDSSSLLHSLFESACRAPPTVLCRISFLWFGSAPSTCPLVLVENYPVCASLVYVISLMFAEMFTGTNRVANEKLYCDTLGKEGGHSSVRRLLYSDDTLLSPQALQSKVHSGNVPCVSANIMLYSLTLPFHHALSSLMSHCIL